MTSLQLDQEMIMIGHMLEKHMEKENNSSQSKSLYRYWKIGVAFYIGIVVYFMA